MIVFFVGKWHKEVFTNQDVIDILDALGSDHVNSARQRFYDLFVSHYQTKWTKYQLWTKALDVQNKTKPQRKSSRQASRSRKKSSSVTTSTISTTTSGRRENGLLRY